MKRNFIEDLKEMRQEYGGADYVVCIFTVHHAETKEDVKSDVYTESELRFFLIDLSAEGAARILLEGKEFNKSSTKIVKEVRELLEKGYTVDIDLTFSGYKLKFTAPTQLLYCKWEFKGNAAAVDMSDEGGFKMTPVKDCPEGDLFFSWNKGFLESIRDSGK